MSLCYRSEYLKFVSSRELTHTWYTYMYKSMYRSKYLNLSLSPSTTL